jgi:hypothetical protein
MAIGKNISACLARLGWSRKDLLERVPNLTPQALSNLILRDSKRSEWDQAIAEALGVSIYDLVYGDVSAPTNIHATGNVTPICAAEPSATYTPINELVTIAETMTDRGVYELIGYARHLASQHQKAKANLVS